jgi:hypothetical protein
MVAHSIFETFARELREWGSWLPIFLNSNFFAHGLVLRSRSNAAHLGRHFNRDRNLHDERPVSQSVAAARAVASSRPAVDRKLHHVVRVRRRLRLPFVSSCLPFSRAAPGV